MTVAEHAHVVGGGAIHAMLQPLFAAPQVAGADHHGHFHAHVIDFLDAARDGFRFIHINAESRRAADGLSAQA